jgi:uncharacterized phage protein (TIGR02218 family)
MTFNGRPVFEFRPNWAREPRVQFTYDLRELNIGFGLRRFGQTAEHVVNGWELLLTLQSEAEIVAFEQFADSLLGRVSGFWLPSLLRAARIVAGVSATQFDIEGQNLATRWQDNASQFLWLERDANSAAGQCAQIASVADNGNGTERVTLTAPLATPVDATWSCNRLLYVRMAADQEQAESIGLNQEQRTVRVVELPLEYTSVEIGQQPVYLYHFWAVYGATTVHWRFTSFQLDITSNGNTFTSQAITHGALRKSLRGQSEEVELRATYEAGQPLADFFPVVLTRPLWVEIIEAPYATPNSTTVLFTGRVGAPRKKGMEITARARSLLDILTRQLPCMVIGSRCNYSLYEPNTCRVNQATHENSITIVSVSANQIVVSGTFTSEENNWFALGYVEFGTGAQLEVRDILQSTFNSGTGNHTLWLAAPLRYAVATSTGKMYPGCAKTPEVCEDKFANYVNYGGHPVVPVVSLNVRAMPLDTANGNKK